MPVDNPVKNGWCFALNSVATRPGVRLFSFYTAHEIVIENNWITGI
jgi:hypothetical protein